ncbi:hypothetical protein AVEN_105645-1 [Araneus ventricosus]|uniref:Uncharacterized protein n=1 Tax=Araneus ventricosus TaxID=182803 RepID=A0A4Y2X3U9_ARAVE|nr:hypothetical protein AVEN_105645-1 [Araneus ventricosus]
MEGFFLFRNAVIPSASAFSYLTKHNLQELSTFREAYEKKGLMENDNHWDLTIDEAVTCKSFIQFRERFAILIVASCAFINPQQMREKYKNDMPNDVFCILQELNGSTAFLHSEALTKVEYKGLQ